jgi:hypothetical protein
MCEPMSECEHAGDCVCVVCVCCQGWLPPALPPVCVWESLTLVCLAPPVWPGQQRRPLGLFLFARYSGVLVLCLHHLNLCQCTSFLLSVLSVHPWTT